MEVNSVAVLPLDQKLIARPEPNLLRDWRLTYREGAGVI